MIDEALFDRLMEEKPAQYLPEWRMFLNICHLFLVQRGIKNPLVVELGTYRNRQKRFYEQLFNARHIGIDIAERKTPPDILGDTGERKTHEELKKKLNGEMIDILYIDASHGYEKVKRDFELYSPLCTGIIAMHDIDLGRHQDLQARMAWKYWDELKRKAYDGDPGFKDSLIISLHQYKGTGDRSQPGTGLIIRGRTIS